MSQLRRISENAYSEDNKSNDQSSEFALPSNNINDASETRLSMYLAKKETRSINLLKIIVIIILLTATALASVLVYKFSSKDETNAFESTFNEYSNQIIAAVQNGAQHKLEAIGSLAEIVQAHAINSNSTWPFVTVPFFEEHVLATRSLTEAYGILFFPIVTLENRKAWEQYSIANRHWVNDSYDCERDYFGSDQSISLGPGENWNEVLWGKDRVNPMQPNMSLGIASEIFRTRFPDDPSDHLPKVDRTNGPYFPQWQAASMSAYYQSTVNLNYGCYDDFYNSTEFLNETGNAVNGLAWTDPVVPGYITTMLYPIFDKFHGARKVVGFMDIDIYWHDYLQRILPPGSGAIDVVVMNDFDQVFTFEVVGQEVNFLGDGDLHDAKFDGMEKDFLFGSELMDPITSPTYTGTPLYSHFGVYNFYLYPTQELQDLYVTKKPVNYTILVCFIFFFTSCIFVAYACMVEKRQKMVMKSAVTSDAIVSSLFPTAVKERLYNSQDEKKTKHEAKNPFAASERMMEVPSTYGDEMENPNGPPIAELYPDTTILFAGRYFLYDMNLLEVRLLIYYFPQLFRHCWLYCLEFGSRTS